MDTDERENNDVGTGGGVYADSAADDEPQFVIRGPGPGPEPFTISGIEPSIRFAQRVSRRAGFTEMLDENGYIIAAFIFGHQLAVNRFWRDELAEDEPQAQKE